MSLEQIHAAIPHRPPMLLVDEILEQHDRRIVCRKTFHQEEFFFQGHYPDFAVVPGVILCECGMQAGAILLSKFIQQNTGGVPVATRLGDVKFKRMVRPGDTVQMEVELVEQIASAFFLKAKVDCEGKTAARFEFACTIATVS